MSSLQNNISKKQKNKILEAEKHKKELKQANDFYLYTLIFSAAVVLGGIIYAVAVRVFIGLLIAIAGILIYVALSTNIIYRTLGISYKTEAGRLTVTDVYGRGRKTVYIPSRLILCRVTEIGDQAFGHKSSADVREVYLPSSITRIGSNIFEGCHKVKKIYFDGSRSQWEQVESLTSFSNYEIIFTDGEDMPSQSKEEK